MKQDDARRRGSEFDSFRCVFSGAPQNQEAILSFSPRQTHIMDAVNETLISERHTITHARDERKKKTNRIIFRYSISRWKCNDAVLAWRYHGDVDAAPIDGDHHADIENVKKHIDAKRRRERRHHKSQWNLLSSTWNKFQRLTMSASVHQLPCTARALCSVHWRRDEMMDPSCWRIYRSRSDCGLTSARNCDVDRFGVDCTQCWEWTSGSARDWLRQLATWKSRDWKTLFLLNLTTM